MARKNRKKSRSPKETPGWRIYLLPALFLLVEVIVLPGATSPFRLAKHFVVITGLALIVSFGIAGKLRKSHLEVPGGRLAAILLFLPVLQFVSAIWSATPLRAISSACVTVVWITGAIWIASLDQKQRQRILDWTLFGASISAIVMLLQAAGMSFQVLGGGSGNDRTSLTGLAGNPSDLAMASVLLFPLILPTLKFNAQQRLRWLVAGLLVLVVVLSQSITGVGAALLTLLVWGLMHSNSRIKIISVGLVTIIVVTAIVILPSERVQKQLHRLESGKWYALLSAREDGWSAAVQMIKNTSFIGVGANHFTHWYYPSRLQWLEDHDEIGRRGELATHFSWAHCDPLQLVAELGGGGALWLLVLCLTLFRTRVRGDPVPLLALTAFVPFAMLHYPSHLAVGLVPVTLIFAHILAGQPPLTVRQPALVPRAALMIFIIGLGLSVATYEIRNSLLDAWRGAMESMLVSANQAEPEVRSRMAAAIELQSAVRLQQNRSAGGWILRIVGKARLLRDNSIGAETAFRTAHSFWPHEESEFGLGLALAAQGRRREAIIHLDRVCRTNPALAQMIPDPDLRKSLQIMGKHRRIRNR